MSSLKKIMSFKKNKFIDFLKYVNKNLFSRT